MMGSAIPTIPKIDTRVTAMPSIQKLKALESYEILETVYEI